MKRLLTSFLSIALILYSFFLQPLTTVSAANLAESYPNTVNPERVDAASSSAGLSVDATGSRIVYESAYNQASMYDLTTHTSKVVYTYTSFISIVGISGDGKSMIVLLDGSTSTDNGLVWVNLDTGATATIASSGVPTTPSPTITNNGRYVSYAVNTKSSYVVYDTTTKTAKTLDKTKFSANSSNVLSGGKVFTSNDGVWFYGELTLSGCTNIWKYNLQTNSGAAQIASCLNIVQLIDNDTRLIVTDSSVSTTRVTQSLNISTKALTTLFSDTTASYTEPTFSNLGDVYYKYYNISYRGFAFTSNPTSIFTVPVNAVISGDGNYLIYVAPGGLYRSALADMKTPLPDTKAPTGVLNPKITMLRETATITWDINPTASGGYKVYVDGGLVDTTTAYKNTSTITGLSSFNKTYKVEIEPIGFGGVVGPRYSEDVFIPYPSQANLGNKIAYVGDYVSFAGKTWRVLSSNYLIANPGEFADAKYYATNTASTNFKASDSSSIGYALNTTYFNSLSAADKALFNKFSYETKSVAGNSLGSELTYLGLLGYDDLTKIAALPFTIPSTWTLVSNSESTSCSATRYMTKNTSISTYPCYNVSAYQPVTHLVDNIAVSGGDGTNVSPYTFSGTIANLIPAPLNLAVGAITDSSLTLRWDEVPGATSYEVSRDGTPIGTATDATFSDSGLTASTTYNYTVVAKTSTATSVPAAIEATTTAPTVIAAPATFTATAMSFSTVGLSWDSVPGATGYEVKRGTDVILTTEDATTFLDQGLSPETTYNYSVVAKDATSTSVSKTASATTLAAPVASPTNFKTLTVTKNSAVLAWDVVQYATAYDVYRDNDLVYSGPANSFADFGLTPDTLYQYKVVAKNATTTGSPSSLNVTTLEDALSAPSSFTAIGSTENSISMIWNSVDGAGGYVVRRSNGSVAYMGPNTYLTDYGLNASTNYTYKVYAFKSGVNSPETSGTFSTTAPIVVGTAPVIVSGDVNFRATNITTDSVTVKMNAVTDSVYYAVYRDGTQVYWDKNLTFTDTGLDQETTYTYSLKAFNDYGASNTVSIDVTTKGFPPTAPQNLKFIRVYPDKASFQWDKVANAKKYILTRDDSVIAYEGTSTAYLDETLAPLTTYGYRVSAVNDFGTSAESDKVMVTTVDEPTTIVISQPQDVEGTITFSFKTVEGAYEYHVERNPHWVFTDNGDGTFHSTWSDSVTGETKDLGNVTADASGKLAISDSKVTPGNSYNYDIIAVVKKPDGSEEVVGGSKVEIDYGSDGTLTTSPTTPVDDGTGPIDGGTGGDGGTGNGGTGDGGTGDGGTGDGGTGDGTGDGTGGGHSHHGGGGGPAYNPAVTPSEGTKTDEGSVDTSPTGGGSVLDKEDLSWVIDKIKSCKLDNKSPDFSDVTGHWAADDIVRLASSGIINGYDDKTFKPDSSITRAEFAAMFVRSLCLSDVKADKSFDDVNSSDWFYSEVNTASYLGLIDGVGEGRFEPSRNITREEMSAVISRFVVKAKLASLVSEADSADILSKFLDRSEVSDWSSLNMATLIKMGLLTGIKDDVLAPKDETTRAQVAALFDKVLSIVENK